MSTNLLSKTCVHCGAGVELREEPRPVTEEETRWMPHEYEGMIVAKAECPDCLAKYLAWMSYPRRRPFCPQLTNPPFDGTIFDLSYRSSFNDQPGPQDLPRYRIVVKTILCRVPFGTSESECPDTTERQWKP